MQNKTEQIASTYLGKKVSGSEKYDSSLIVSIPRFENRVQYDINCDNLPFDGWDIWHAYEFSALTDGGVPFTRLLKLKYSCNSEFLVESKSLKLYLNSFNMTRFGKTISESLNICKKIIEQDLSVKLKTSVQAEFFDNNTMRTDIFCGFQNIMDLTSEENINIDKFKETPELLQTNVTEEKKEYYLTFESLRSNCRVTHQPDFGDVFIYYKSYKHIVESSLVKYLTSFRSEYHFHEECCEMIFKRLFDILNDDDELFVCALYTRRGGIDICPVRWSKNFVPVEVEDLINLKKFARYGIKQ